MPFFLYWKHSAWHIVQAQHMLVNKKWGGKIGRKDGKKEKMIEKGREVHKMK